MFELPDKEQRMKEQTTEQQANAIRDVYLDARNKANLSLLDEIYLTDVVVHDPSQPQGIFGLAALKAQYETTHAAIPDVKFSMDEMFVKGDKIAWVFTMSGTITGVFSTPLGELPPTGKTFRFSGVAVDRVVGGRIAEEWVYFNVLEILQPLGFTLAPPKAPLADEK